IQTAGRAARHIRGEVIFYADHMTGSMSRAIEEMNRRRDAQLAYNAEHGIVPQTIVKSVEEIMRSTSVADAATALAAEEILPTAVSELDRDSLMELLEREMLAAAAREEFEVAAVFRDRLDELRLSPGKETAHAPRGDRPPAGPSRADRGPRRRGRYDRRGR
ncbi:MAG TPA: UvrB/UvrC motif-containing protein, partial [Candidatus Eisenbacteria bacterium]|nr:UvrB/UvrC motif-containing protein [Candidatus Eisenbacteria bacterium]